MTRAGATGNESLSVAVARWGDQLAQRLGSQASHNQAFWKTRSFCCYIERLCHRYGVAARADIQLREAVVALEVEAGGPEPDVRAAQLAVVDATEAYHEQVYSSMGAFAMVLGALLPHEEKRGFSS